jgi:hypothetical protein
MNLPSDCTSGAERRACVAEVLAAYPEIDEKCLADILHWIKKEASSLDVALLASDPKAAEGYRRFHADHLDRLTPGDIVKGILFVVAVAAVIAAIVWRVL